MQQQILSEEGHYYHYSFNQIGSKQSQKHLTIRCIWLYKNQVVVVIHLTKSVEEDRKRVFKRKGKKEKSPPSFESDQITCQLLQDKELEKELQFNDLTI